MLDKYVIFCDRAPDFRIEDGLVHVTDHSGKLVFERVMSLKSFRDSIAKANGLIAEWTYEQLDEAERETPVVPFRRKRK